MGSMEADRCSWKTTGMWIHILLIYLYGTCQSASAESCSMTLTAREGEITSPGYPSNYNNNLDCTYVIAGSGQTITIDVLELDLETNSGCSYDWLIIDGGPKLCNATTFHKTYVFRHRFVINFRSDGSNTGRGFKIRYSIEGNDNCTANHLKTSGRISTPCYACNCTYNNCTNTIIGSGKLQTLILDFVSLNFKTSSNCDLGWFNIDGGPRICTSTPFKTTYAFGGIIDIVTHGGEQSVDSCAGFIANYVVEDTCSTTLTASEGEITSPGYPGTVYNYLTCTYVIVGDGQNQSITIDLVDLDVEERDDCGYGWLIIDDGPKLCRSHTTYHKTYVFQDRFIIKFRSDYRSPSIGFKMHYSVGVDADDTCTSIHLKTSGQISTPCYSCNCTYNNCTNIIIGNWKVQTLILDFVSLNFPTSANCDRGWFTIDGGPKMCTSTPFKTTYAFIGSVDIVTGGGYRPGDSCASFVVNYFVQDSCLTVLTASEGEITSPGYPGNYINNLNCTYVIVGDGQTESIIIDLVELDLEETSDCHLDWLVIGDGPKLCYPTPFHKTYVFRDRFVIKFGTDGRETRRGFKIRYSFDSDAHDNCTFIHLKTSGQISTPCYSCNCTNNNCTNTIIGSGKLQTLILDFISLNFTTSANCDLGWFTIDGGPRICTLIPFKKSYAFFSSVDIVTNGGNRSVDSCAGFVVNYDVEDNCSTTLTASKGEITSPGYPGIPYNYPTCTYVIVGGGQSQSISIDLVDLDVLDCSFGWLIIDDGPKLCRSRTTFHKTYFFWNRFIIKFRTDYIRKTRGLKIRYSIGVDVNDTCTSTHLKTSGQISTPCYSCNCTYSNLTNTIIGSGKLQILTLDFVSLNFTASPNCDQGWFTIDGGPRICTSTPFKTTYAFFGSLDIVTHGGGRSVNSAGFLLNYVVKDKCSTTLTASEGEITTPGYLCPPYNYLTCTYVIVGDGQNQSITIDLVELDLQVIYDCPYDWLIIDDGPNLCYETTFHKTYAFQDKFIIKFRSDYRSRGFKMHYAVDVDAHDTCTSIHFTASGQILTPCFYCNCTNNNCTNTIIGSGKLQTLTLDFVSLNFTTSADCDLGWFTIDGGPKICTSTPFKTTYAFFGSADIVTHGGGRSVDTCGGFVVDYVVEDVDNNKLMYTTNSGQLVGPLFPGAGSTFQLTSTYIIVGHVSQQSLILDITVRSYNSRCSYAKLTLNGTEDLCISGRYNRTYFSQNNFTIEFRYYYFNSSFLIHYEKEDITKGKPLL